LQLVFEDGTRAAFTDPRRLGRIKVSALPSDDEAAEPPELAELGPDPLLHMMPLPAFAAGLASRSIAVKTLLMDQARPRLLRAALVVTEFCDFIPSLQSFIAGIGNYLAGACCHCSTGCSLYVSSHLHGLQMKSCTKHASTRRLLLMCSMRTRSHAYTNPSLILLRTLARSGKLVTTCYLLVNVVNPSAGRRGFYALSA
jgi:hypothetical protein